MLLMLLPECTPERGARSTTPTPYPRSISTRRFLASSLAIVSSVLGFARAASAQSDSAATKLMAAAKDDIRVENLKELNTDGDEACPFVGSDGSMYFLSKRGGKSVIYLSKR